MNNQVKHASTDTRSASLTTEGITCCSCEECVERASEVFPGVEDFCVNLATAPAVIRGLADIDKFVVTLANVGVE